MGQPDIRAGRAGRSLRTLASLLVPVVCSALLSGCATARSEFSVPSGEPWRQSLASALRDPDTWIPAAAALAFAAAGADDSVSDWASEKTPIFGSIRRADNASDELKGATHVLMFASAIPPLGSHARLERFAVTAFEQEAIVVTTGAVTRVAKQAAGRERPDASNTHAFPSGHSSGSAATSALARENLERSAIPERWHPAVRITSRVLHGATAWARIEAAKHYPTDVLVGSALGNLLAVTIDRAVRDGTEVEVTIAPSREGVFFSARMRF